MGETFVIGGLVAIIVLVLVLPFLVRPIEHNLEFFLFVMGTCAALISKVLTLELVEEALREPLMITTAVLVAGVVFRVFQDQIKGGIDKILKYIPLSFFLILITIVLGLVCSVITAIIASLVLVEVVNNLELDRKNKINFTVLACFAIGLGAALTPIGEPLSTIATSKLEQDFWYLFRTLGPYIIPGIAATSLVTLLFVKTKATGETGALAIEKETYGGIVLRAVKVYVFIMALVFLGEGFKPVIDKYIIHLGAPVLYWINMISAILDNATLTAAEISPKMTTSQIQSVLMGLLISGGMLIPGNIPNIVSAGKLKIGSRDWARLAVPYGLVLLVAYFIILELL